MGPQHGHGAIVAPKAQKILSVPTVTKWLSAMVIID
jgi:hypothetical protein